MKSKKEPGSNFDLKKWSVFFIFLLGLAALLFVLLRPEGEADAREVIEKAQMMNRKAREISLQSNSPEDLANLDQSGDFLEKANALLLESEFVAALNEANNAIRYAEKVINKDDTPSFDSNIRFVELVGEVLIKRKDSLDSEVANKKMTLSLGDELRTDAYSSCLLGHRGGMETWLFPNSRMSLREDLDPQFSGGNIALFLLEGSLNVVTAESSGKRHIHTPSGRARVYSATDTTATILKETSEIQVQVRFGRVDAKVGKRTIVIGSLQVFTYSEREMEGEPENMLAIPQLVNPARASKFKVNNNGFASVPLRWEKVSGADRYHVELASDRLFVNMIEEKKNFSGKSLQLSALKPGAYFWRVACLDQLGNRAMYSEHFQFEVLAATSGRNLGEGSPPKLKIRNTVVQGNIAIIHGRTDRGATIKMNGELALVNKENGSFKHILKLPGYGLHHVNVVAESTTGSLAFKNLTVEIKE